MAPHKPDAKRVKRMLSGGVIDLCDDDDGVDDDRTDDSNDDGNDDERARETEAELDYDDADVDDENDGLLALRDTDVLRV